MNKSVVIFYHAGKLMYKNNSDPIRLCPTPWQLQGEAYILNCWLNPEFLKQAQPFGLAPFF